MSSVIVRCPSCGAKNRIDRARAVHSRVRCARCSTILEVPEPQRGLLEVQDATFSGLVESSPLPVLLEFSSQYCGYCQKFDPVLRAFVAEAADSMLVARMDLDANRGTAARYGVSATPTLLVLEAGKEVDRIEGAVTADALRYRLYRYLH